MKIDRCQNVSFKASSSIIGKTPEFQKMLTSQLDRIGGDKFLHVALVGNKEANIITYLTEIGENHKPKVAFTLDVPSVAIRENDNDFTIANHIVDVVKGAVRNFTNAS